MTTPGRHRLAVAVLTGFLFILAMLVANLAAIPRTMVTDGVMGGGAALAAQLILGRLRR
ncbi:hypothetical protein [Enterovirga sp. CN4-39]|uniref:hypothetical protein n=1 Tax=Enterovirga sp. CN4-39 TaxID=3400910 RepID=UPI003C0B11E1